MVQPVMLSAVPQELAQLTSVMDQARQALQHNAALLLQVEQRLATLQGIPPTLRPTELEILRGIAVGQKYKAIGYRLGLTESTVAKYTQDIKHKLGGTSLPHTITIARDLGLI